MALTKNLKAAILAMPREEKDKLLLRLIGKHNDLQEQLEFKLIEGGETLNERRQAIIAQIDRLYKLSPESSGWLMMDMRSIHSGITHHVKITKDTYGEVELVLYLLNQCFEQQLPFIQNYSSKTDGLAEYIAKRTDAIYKKFGKLHPDIQFEFLEDINRLLERVYDYAPSHYARTLGLPKSIRG
ncbi:MAG: hypothetical protein QM669_11480 [Siphonobacter sp.]